MKFTVFYSWQSIAENGTNRNFIEDAIHKAIKRVDTTALGELKVCLDRDTKGVSGSPSITTAIFEKIDKCDVFVADISLVVGNKKIDQRLSPNPNVLIELGYAVRVLGWERIVMVANEAFANVNEDYPFDIRQHKRISYSLESIDQDRSEAREFLQRTLGMQIQLILNLPVKNQPDLQPVLVPSWLVTTDINDHHYCSKDTLKLYRATSKKQILKRLDYDVSSLDKVNGSIDPKWADKKTAYLKSASTFKARLNDPVKSVKFAYVYSSDHFKRVRIEVENTGGKPASSIRMEFQTPDWLYVSEVLPDIDDAPTYPKVPVPRRPQTSIERNMERLLSAGQTSKLEGVFFNPNQMLPILNKATESTRLSADGRVFEYTCSDLMHKSRQSPDHHSLYFFAHEEAPSGKHKIVGRVICKEYSDWQEVKLEIEIVEMNLKELIASRPSS